MKSQWPWWNEVFGAFDSLITDCRNSLKIGRDDTRFDHVHCISGNEWILWANCKSLLQWRVTVSDIKRCIFLEIEQRNGITIEYQECLARTKGKESGARIFTELCVCEQQKGKIFNRNRVTRPRSAAGNDTVDTLSSNTTVVYLLKAITNKTSILTRQHERKRNDRDLRNRPSSLQKSNALRRSVYVPVTVL